jgi:hypothetical protein
MHQNGSFVILLSLVLILLFIVNKCDSTPLDDYVRAEDLHFGWTLIRTYEEHDYKLYILNFTSQKWLDGKCHNCSGKNKRNKELCFSKESYSSRSIWWHYLCITVPNKLTRANSGFMLIDQGNNSNGYEILETTKVNIISLQYSTTTR